MTHLEVIPFAVGMLRVVWSSLLASLLVILSFSLAILGFVRLAETRGDARSRGATAGYVALSICSLLVFLACIVYGVILVARK